MVAKNNSGSAGIGLVVAGFLAVVVGLGTAWWMAQPDRSVGQYERLSGVIGCMCGTCPNRPIATCGCGFAENMLGELRDLVDEGHDDDQIMTTFVARYSEAIRIKPRGSGMDLTAWAAPMVLLSLGAVFLGAVLVRWTRRGADVPGSTPASAEDEAPEAVTEDETDRLLARVDRELSELEP